MSVPAYYHLLDNVQDRALRGRRIVRILQDFYCQDLSNTLILDIGSGNGHVTRQLAIASNSVIGIDSTAQSVVQAHERYSMAVPELHFLVGTGEQLPFNDAMFDIVICNHIYEHVTSAQALFDEIWRVLKPSGLCYSACAHKLQIIEPHYRLLFLSWLPQKTANTYLKLCGIDELYSIKLVLPWQIRKFFLRFKRATFLTPFLLKDPARYELLKGMRTLSPGLRPFARLFAGLFAWFSSTQHWLLWK